MSTITIATVEDIVAKYSPIAASLSGGSSKEDYAKEREVELHAMTKNQLIAFIIDLEYKPGTKVKVADIAKLILKDEEFLTASHDTVAQAVKALVPDANTSSKSIATYVSKQSEEWGLPDRIIIRQSKPKKPKEETATEEAVGAEDVVEEVE